MQPDRRRWIVSTFVILVAAAVASADVRLPAVIGSNMVLQQGKPATIWGWAEPGEKINVSVSWLDMKWAVAADDQGNWSFQMAVPKVGGPYTMTLAGKNVVELKNVLVGEVWVCSGQSNMQMSVRSSNDADREIAAADYPNIRLFSVKRTVAAEPQKDCEGQWSACTAETIPDFSAVAYFFGRYLHKELNIPIGLIHTSWGGTPAEAWTSDEYMKSDADFEPILKRHNDAVAAYPEAMRQYKEKLAQWQQDVEKAKAEGKNPPNRPGEPYGPGNPHNPSGLYNAMIAPLVPFSIQGAIWYQGESNAGRAYQYRKLFPAMIRSWRDSWGQGEFPFLFVQLANFMAVKDQPGDSAWAELREAQTMTLAMKNTGMAVIIDIGEANDIHPKNKQDVGARLALWALANTYGRGVVHSGPLYKSHRVDGNKVILSFDHVGGGLLAKDGEPLKGFAVAGPDKKFVWAEAKIEGETVVVGSDQVAEPVAVRYAWADNPVCNFYNKEMLPASPFRTDEWPGVTAGGK